MSDPESTVPPVQAAPARRATDLPADAPWWARWLAANLKHLWTVLLAAGAGAAEVYANDPEGVKKAVETVVPAAWWPHLVAFGTGAFAFYRLYTLTKGANK